MFCNSKLCYSNVYVLFVKIGHSNHFKGNIYIYICVCVCVITSVIEKSKGFRELDDLSTKTHLRRSSDILFQ